MIQELLTLWDEYTWWADANPIDCTDEVERWKPLDGRTTLAERLKKPKKRYSKPRPHTMDDFMNWLRERGEE